MAPGSVSASRRWWRSRPVAVAALAGAALTLVQYAAMREFAALLGRAHLHGGNCRGLFGLVAIAVITPALMQFLLALHLLLLVVLVLVLFGAGGGVLAAALSATWCFGPPSSPDPCAYYAKAHGLRDTEVIASGFRRINAISLAPRRGAGR